MLAHASFNRQNLRRAPLPHTTNRDWLPVRRLPSRADPLEEIDRAPPASDAPCRPHRHRNSHPVRITARGRIHWPESRESCLDLPARTRLSPSGLETTKHTRSGHLRSCTRRHACAWRRAPSGQFPEGRRSAASHDPGLRARHGVNRYLAAHRICRARDVASSCSAGLTPDRSLQLSFQITSTRSSATFTDRFRFPGPSRGASLHGATPLQPTRPLRANQGIDPADRGGVRPLSLRHVPGRALPSKRQPGPPRPFLTRHREVPCAPQPRTTEPQQSEPESSLPGERSRTGAAGLGVDSSRARGLQLARGHAAQPRPRGGQPWAKHRLLDMCKRSEGRAHLGMNHTPRRHPFSSGNQLAPTGLRAAKRRRFRDDCHLEGDCLTG